MVTIKRFGRHQYHFTEFSLFRIIYIYAANKLARNGNISQQTSALQPIQIKLVSFLCSLGFFIIIYNVHHKVCVLQPIHIKATCILCLCDLVYYMVIYNVLHKNRITTPTFITKNVFFNTV